MPTPIPWEELLDWEGMPPPLPPPTGLELPLWPMEPSILLLLIFPEEEECEWWLLPPPELLVPPELPPDELLEV